MSEVVDTDSQALHHLLTEAGVDWDGLSGEVARQADALLGDEQAALILDESAFAKKGTASAGVARMWNGRLGKVDNSQVGVFSALCRDQRVTLLLLCHISDSRRRQAAKASCLRRCRS